MPDTHDDSHQMTTVLRDGVWYDFCYSCQRDIGPMVSQARAMIEARLPLTSDEQEVLLAHLDALTAALLPYIRHGATCALQAVRDNAPDDELCTCGLREAWQHR